MTKIAMFTMGTRGDVQPYIYLSKGLTDAGYDVTLGSHPCWKELIESYGIHFEPVGPDINIEEEAAVIRGKSSNAAISMIRCMNFIMKIIQGSSNEVYKLCEGKDLIVVTHSKMGAVEAGVLGVPTVDVTLQTEMIPEKGKPLKFTDKILGNLIGKQVNKPYDKIRRQYGLKPMKTGDEIRSDYYNLIPVSKYVLEPSPYWEQKNIITGYWYEEEKEYVPDEDLIEFIKAGDPPAILALGAMSFESVSDIAKLDMFVNAFQKTGTRAVIQGFKKSITDYNLPDTMISCGNVPHSWLFGLGKFVIHHCGFGTSASSMIYGIPSIPIPHVLDQLGFAMQLEKIDVATKHINAKDLSEEALIAAIEEMTSTYDTKKQNALSISEKIKTEDGIGKAVSLIRSVLEK